MNYSILLSLLDNLSSLNWKDRLAFLRVILSLYNEGFITAKEYHSLYTKISDITNPKGQ